jgi:hypothetical protein
VSVRYCPICDIAECATRRPSSAIQPDPRDAQIAALVEAASERLAYMDMCGVVRDLERDLRSAIAAVKGGDA